MAQFVAISNGAVAGTSPDGITWTTRTLPAATWYALTFNATTYCAVGASVCATSPDGITWTSRTMPSASTWVDVAWNGAVFCAIALNSTAAATSPDGITWTARTMPSASTWRDIAWNGAVFCAIASGTDVCATSPDGITWTTKTLPSSTTWQAIAWNDTVFCAIALNSAAAATSPDGITWTSRTLPASDAWFDIAWNGAVFCVTAQNGTVAATSPDGITWTSRTMPSVAPWRDIAWNGAVFCVVTADTSTTAATSPNGITWTSRTLPASSPSVWVDIVGANVGLINTLCASSKNLPIITASSSGVSNSLGASTADLMQIVAYGGAFVNNDSNATLEPIGASGTALGGTAAASTQNLLQIVVTQAAADGGSVGTGSKQLSLLTHTKSGVNRGLGEMGRPMLAYTKSMTADSGLPKTTQLFTKSMVGKAGVVSIFTLVKNVQLFTKLAEADAGNTGTMSKQLRLADKKAWSYPFGSMSKLPRKFVKVGSGVVGVTGVAYRTRKLSSSVKFGYAPTVGLASKTLRAFSKAMLGQQSDGVILSTITMHTERQAFTQYTNYPFNSFAKFNDVYLGASSAGLFALSGATDKGAAIDATVKFGVTEFGSSHMKRVDMLYVDYRADGELNLRVTTDDVAVNDYAVMLSDQTGLHPTRVPIGKGLIARHWQFEVQNVAGADFEINTVEAHSTASQRRVNRA